MSDVPRMTSEELRRATRIVAVLLRRGCLPWAQPPMSVSFVFVPRLYGPERSQVVTP